MNSSLPAKTASLDSNRRYQDEMVELRVAAVKARWTIRALLAACCAFAALSAGLGVKVALTSAPAQETVSIPTVIRVNAEDPREQIRQANDLQKAKKPAVPVRNAGKKAKITLT